MEQRLNQILARRRQSFRLWFFRPSLTAAIALHVVLLVGVLLGPTLFAERQAPIEYVSVQVVPAHLLRPKPKPKPKPKTPPKPVEQPKPEPEPEPEPPPALVEEPKDETPPAPEPEPTPEPAEPEPVAEDGPTAVLGFDNPDFVYGYYVDRMLSLIRSQWVRPPVGGDVEMVAHFRIQRDGTVSQLKIVTSSGIDSFDLAALRAIQGAAPLPPLPRSYRRSSLGVTLIIR